MTHCPSVRMQYYFRLRLGLYLLSLWSIVGCGASQKKDASGDPPCPDGQQRYEQVCLSQAMVEFKVCVQDRGVRRSTSAHSSNSTEGGANIAIGPMEAGGSGKTSENQDRSEAVEATASDCAVIRNCSRLAGLPPLACDDGNSADPCEDGTQRYEGRCLSSKMVEFISCIDKRGLRKTIIERTLESAVPTARRTPNEPQTGKVMVITETESSSVPNENDCKVIQACSLHAGVPVDICGNSTLGGYPNTPEGLAQALVAVDQNALNAFMNASSPSGFAGEALRTVSTAGLVAKRYFKEARSSESLQWLSFMLERSEDPLDPNLRVPFSDQRNEALINVAMRASNRNATTLLLKAGATPHGYQKLDYWVQGSPRFLNPFTPILENKSFSFEDKEGLIDDLLQYGAVIPKVPTPVTTGGLTYGPIAHDTVWLVKKFAAMIGKNIQVSLHLCDRPSAPGPKAACQRADRIYGTNWCETLKNIPVLFGDTRVNKDNIVVPFIVRYFLGANADSGYFLVEELSYYSGYALLEVAPDLRQLRLVRFTNQRPLDSGGCENDPARIGYCWRGVELSRNMSTGQYDHDYGPPFAVSRSCQDAEKQAALRVQAVAPRPFTHSNPKVAQCVNEIIKTPTMDLLDEASHFNLLSQTRLNGRGCVLAQINSSLIMGGHGLLKPGAITSLAKTCCEKTQ